VACIRVGIISLLIGAGFAARAEAVSDHTLACQGLLLPAVTIEVPKENERLKPYYENHIANALRIFEGWALPPKIRISFGEPRLEPYANAITNEVFVPALREKTPPAGHRKKIGAVANPEASVAIAVHELGHLLIHGKAGKVSPLWKRIHTRIPELQVEIGAADREVRMLRWDVEQKTGVYFARSQPLEHYPAEWRPAYREIQERLAKADALVKEALSLQKFYNFGSIAYQEVFSDLVAVLYREDLAAIPKALRTGEAPEFSLGDLAFRDFSRNYGTAKEKRWLAAVHAGFKRDEIGVHMLFGPARARIGGIIGGRLHSLAGKQKAVRALADAIGFEIERLGMHHFDSPPAVDWPGLNAALAEAFEREWLKEP
jgi:hypothetical protein